MSKNKPLVNDNNLSNAKKKSRSFVERMLSKDSRLILISFLTALIIWFYVSMYDSPVISKTFTDIPVVINMTDSTPAGLGLEIFGNSEYKVSVTLSGPRYLIADKNFTSADIAVTANTNYVNSPGTAILELKASVLNRNTDIVVESLSNSSISVYFDKPMQKELTVKPVILSDNELIAGEGYLADSPISSLSKVVASGPATEIDKLIGVDANARLSSVIYETTTVDAKLAARTSDGSALRYVKFDNTDAAVTVPVRKIVTLPTSVAFTSSPLAYSSEGISYSCSPSSVTAAVLTKDLESIKSVSVGSIDFSDIDAEYNTFTFSSADISDVVIIDDVDSFTVTVDAASMSKQAFELSITSENLQLSGVPSGFSVSPVTIFMMVNIIGNEASLASLDLNGVFIEVDLSDRNLSSGVHRVPCDVIVKSNTDCWCYGDYFCQIDIKEKQ